MSMGYASSCLTDGWSLFNNVSGLAKVDQPSAAFSYHTIPGLRSLDRMAACFALPLTGGTAAAGVFRFGGDLYNEHTLSVGYANTFGIASLGLRADYLQIVVKGFETRSLFSLSFGGITELTPWLTIGAHIKNVNQPVVDTDTKEKLPTLMAVGLSVIISPSATIVTEVEKDLSYDPLFKCGMEYRISKKLFARTGLTINPQAFFAGLGFEIKHMKLDYAVQHSQTLGIGHQASVSRTLRRKK